MCPLPAGGPNEDRPEGSVAEAALDDRICESLYRGELMSPPAHTCDSRYGHAASDSVSADDGRMPACMLLPSAHPPTHRATSHSAPLPTRSFVACQPAIRLTSTQPLFPLSHASHFVFCHLLVCLRRAPTWARMAPRMRSTPSCRSWRPGSRMDSGRPPRRRPGSGMRGSHAERMRHRRGLDIISDRNYENCRSLVIHVGVDGTKMAIRSIHSVASTAAGRPSSSKPAHSPTLWPP